MKPHVQRRPLVNRRLRKVLLISLPIWLVAALFCVKLVSMTVENRAGTAAYESGDHGAARTHFSRLRVGNVAESWIAHYNRGTANHQLRAYPAARSDFEKALKSAPPAQQCKVRINLALTLEALGDDEGAAQNADRAAELYREADKVLADANCGDPTPDGQPSNQPSPSGQPSSEPSKGSSGKPSQNPSGKPSGGPSGQPSSDPNGEPTSNPNGEPTDGPEGGEQGEQGKEGKEPGGDSPEQQQQRKEETQQRLEDKAEEADRNARRNENRKPPEPSEQDQSDPNQSPESKQEQQAQQNKESQKENAESRDREKGKSDKTEGKAEDPGGKKRPW